MSSTAATVPTTTVPAAAAAPKKQRAPKAAAAVPAPVAAAPAPVAAAPVAAAPAPVVAAAAPKKQRAPKAAAAAPAVAAPAVAETAAPKKQRAPKRKVEDVPAAAAAAAPAPEASSSSSSSEAPAAAKPKRRRVVVKKAVVAGEEGAAAAPKPRRARPPVPQYVALPKITDFSDEAVNQARAHFQWFARHVTRNRLIRLYKDIALQAYNDLRVKSKKSIDEKNTEIAYNNRLSSNTYDNDFKSLNGVWLSDFSIKGKFNLVDALKMLKADGKIGDSDKSRRIGIILSQCVKRKIKPAGVVSEARGENGEYKFGLGDEESKRVYVGPTIKFKKLEAHVLSFDKRTDSVYQPRDKQPRGTRRITSLFPTITKKKVAASSEEAVVDAAVASSSSN